MSSNGSAEIEPFRVAVDDATIADLHERLDRTRWPDQIDGAEWDYGTERGYLQRLCEHWRQAYDWRAFEERLNRFEQFTTVVDGQRLHFFHVRSPQPDAVPLLLTHGWPGSVAEFLDVLGPLSDPEAHDGEGRDAFHVIAPSLPGYGFSGPTSRRGIDAQAIADLFDGLMARLGYERYLAQGGDWGALITTQLGARHPDRVAAIHLNMVPVGPPPGEDPMADLTEAELAGIEAGQRFRRDETGYQAIQGTKPQTLAYGLTDSPSGLAGWIVEKFRTWSDCGGDLDASFTPDQLLDNISIYWITGTIGSSMRLYYETIGPTRRRDPVTVTVPTGCAMFPGELFHPPRRWAERWYPIERWTPMPRGGHFAAMEEPELFVDDVRAFFRDHRALA